MVKSLKILQEIHNIWYSFEPTNAPISVYLSFSEAYPPPKTTFMDISFSHPQKFDKNGYFAIGINVLDILVIITKMYLRQSSGGNISIKETYRF